MVVNLGDPFRTRTPDLCELIVSYAMILHVSFVDPVQKVITTWHKNRSTRLSSHVFCIIDDSMIVDEAISRYLFEIRRKVEMCTCVRVILYTRRTRGASFGVRRAPIGVRDRRSPPRHATRSPGQVPDRVHDVAEPAGFLLV